MRYDELSVEQQEQVHARFSVTLTGNALRDYDYTLTDDGNILSRRYRAELARREQAKAAPRAWTIEPQLVDGWDRWNIIDTTTQRQIAAMSGSEAEAALIARAPELLAENEHLRAKLAEGPPQNVHQYKSALANMEQTINDLHRKNDSNNALMTEGAQKIGELRIENARLRSLLAECVEIIDTLMNDGLLGKPQFAAIETAKETING